MRKKLTPLYFCFKKFGIILFAFLLIIAGCKKSNISSSSELEEYEKWYNQNKPVAHNSAFDYLKPIWESTYISEQGDISVLEISLSNPKNVYQRIDNKIESQLAHSKNNIRLLIFKDKTNGEIITGCYMSVVNESETVQNLSDIHYKQAKDFSGKIMFFNMTGGLENGWEYNKGSITKRINGTIDGYYYGSKNILPDLKSPALIENRNSGINKLMTYSPPTCAFPQPDYKQSCVGIDGYLECTTYVAGYTCIEGGSDGSGGYNPYPTNPAPGGSGGIGSSNTEIISEFKDYPCAKALVTKMQTLKSDIANLIKGSFGKSTGPNVIFEPAMSLVGTTTDGRLSSVSSDTYRIWINPDVLNNASQEFIIVTLYHEALHAYLAVQKQRLGNVEFDRQFNGLTVNGGRLIGVQDPAHVPMACTNYLNGLRDVIIAFNPQYDTTRAQALAKGGIMSLSAAENNINNEERDTTKPGYQGTKCP